MWVLAPWSFVPTFSFSSFRVSSLMVNFVVVVVDLPFGVDICSEWAVRNLFYSFMFIYLIFPTPLIKKCKLSPGNDFKILGTNKMSVAVYLWI